MIVRIRGELCEVTDDAAIVDRDGIAYEVMVPGYAVAELSAARGREVMLHTLQHLEGNAAGGNMTPRIIGFPHPEDRAFFKQFITVKGMGVRKGLRALASPVTRIASDIEAGDATALTRLPGVGRRMADQIVAQLRGKMGAYVFADNDVPAATKQDFSDDERDAIEILIAWGDVRCDAERWIARAGQLHETMKGPEEWVKAAYRIKGGSEA